jgi:UDP-N-acetylglucosamine:LPS N-acetylglucosamine transferase
MTPANLGRLLHVIEQVQPQLIITTHAFLSYATARAIERYRKRIPLVFQLTDLGRLHMTWFTEKHADAYLAPTREIFAQTLKQGIDKTRVHLTGRPVRSQFLDAPAGERNAILTSLGFDPTLFTVFLQGGAKGSASVDRTIKSLLRINVPIQIILAVGNNQQMAARYAENKQVRALPFVEKIAPYMAAADVVAGKAGASFITEAFMLEKPFIVTAFIPSQETPNLHFIERHNLGWICPKLVNQQTLFTKLARNPEMLTEKVESIRAYQAWNKQANQHILPIIDGLVATAMR